MGNPRLSLSERAAGRLHDGDDGDPDHVRVVAVFIVRDAENLSVDDQRIRKKGVA
jgi:hypothetical protein